MLRTRKRYVRRPLQIETKIPVKDPLLFNALRLWTANRLLMKGWRFSGRDTLGMTMFADGSTPAPRVLQNQLDHRLESYIAQVEVHVLTDLQKAMLRTPRNEWINVFIVVVIILHVRERDIWRLAHWIINPDGVSVQSHPSNYGC